MSASSFRTQEVTEPPAAERLEEVGVGSVNDGAAMESGTGPTQRPSLARGRTEHLLEDEEFTRLLQTSDLGMLEVPCSLN